MSQFTVEQLRLLLALQDLDSRIDADQAGLQRATDGAVTAPVRERMATALATVTDRETKLASMRRDLRYAEQETASLRAEIEAQEKKLYGGTVRNPKEAAQLQQHVALLHKRLTELDDRAVELMLAVEEYQPEVAAAKESVERLQMELTGLEQVGTAEAVRISLELPGLTSQRDAVAAEVPAALLREYRNIRARRGGIAVTALVDGKCSRCRMTIPYVMSREVRGGLLRTCDNCGRIVVEPE